MQHRGSGRKEKGSENETAKERKQARESEGERQPSVIRRRLCFVALLTAAAVRAVEEINRTIE